MIIQSTYNTKDVDFIIPAKSLYRKNPIVKKAEQFLVHRDVFVSAYVLIVGI